MLSSLFLLNPKGEILVYRAYKSDASRVDAVLFCQRVVASKETSECPIQSVGSGHFVHITSGDVILVACCKNNSNITLAIRFLYKMKDTLCAYFSGEINEGLVRKNLVLIYELLDEVVDGGYPQILELDVLQKYITQSDKKRVDLMDAEALKKIIVQATGSCSWRAEGIKHRRNEVYIDVVEDVNLLVSQKGQTLISDVNGKIVVKCLLSGMPECKFGMNDKVIMGTSSGTAGSAADGTKSEGSKRVVSLDDCRFHQCVRLSKFDLDRTITFIPPDGTFELMSYRTSENLNPPFKLFPVIQERGRTKVEVSLLVKAMYGKNMTGANVVIKIPVPHNTAKANLASINAGKAKFESTLNALVWRIWRFPGDMEYTLRVDIDLAQSMTEQKWNRPPIEMSFQVPMFTASGLCVRFLRVQEKSNYKPVKWIRYITKAGTYQHRI